MKKSTVLLLSLFLLVSMLALSACDAGAGDVTTATPTTAAPTTAAPTTTAPVTTEAPVTTVPQGPHTVTFLDYDGVVLLTTTVEHGGTVEDPGSPEREGYGFCGWNGSLENIVADITLTATYRETVEVEFLDYDGTVLYNETVFKGEALSSIPDAPIRYHYAFTGWSNTNFEEITADLVVTAQYVRTHRVNFYDYDGTVLKTEFVLPDMPATAPSTPIREGYVFDGWDVSFTTVTTDLSVNAIYRVATYTVTFVNPSGAVLLTTEGVKHGQYAEPPAVSDAYFDWNALRAYRFKEWSATTDQVTEDMVVHAIYEEEVKEPVLVARNAEITRGSENVLITLFLCPGSVFYGLSLDVRFDPALTLGGQPTVVVRETFGKAEEDKGAADYTSSLNANGNYEFRWTNGEGVDPAKFSGPVTILTFDLHLDEFQATGLYTLDILESSYLITDTFQKVTPVLIDGVVTVK